MCLRVDAGGNGDGKGTHILVSLYLMAGENDANLEWPMRGTFSIVMLNQEKDGNHKNAQYVLMKQNHINRTVKSAKVMHHCHGEYIDFLNTKTLKKNRFLPRHSTSKMMPFTFELP